MLKKLFGKKEELKGNEVRLVLPEEEYGVLEWKADGWPCVAVLNSALKDFEPKKIFSWHLSVIIDFDDLIESGMPSQEERDIVDPFCDKLDEEIKAGGNALFLIRETWNKTRRLVWRVYDPGIAHEHLQYIVDHHRHPRPFDWHMEQDMEWEQAKWYFEQIKT
ncbi:DUF695 domain-containing protein [Halopseudomonas sabulinigri]|uniref:DUF695 domain-containing protein n=1 Tax=Halopseudomonas sabulinigri TaxID=472181 RepID=A0ABP9ZLK5_9GAMM